MKFLIMNQELLSRLSHHWLFGLGVDRSFGVPLADTIAKLSQSASHLNQAATQVSQIQNRFVVIRALYWFFNIQNYRLNYYALQGYCSQQLYAQGIHMLAQKQQEISAKIGAFHLKSGLKILWDKVPSISRPNINLSSIFPTNWLPQARLAQAEIPILELAQMSSTLVAINDESDRPSPTLIEDDSLERTFIVTAAVHSYMQVLGMPHEINNECSLLELRKAYLKRALKTHPDKNLTVDTSELFKEVNTAYEQILLLLKASAQNASPDIDDNDLVSIIKKMQEENDALLQELKNQTDDYCRRVDAHLANVARSNAAVDDYCADMRLLREEYAEHFNRVEQTAQRVEQTAQRVEQTAQRVEQTAQRVNELSAEIQEFVAQAQQHLIWSENQQDTQQEQPPEDTLAPGSTSPCAISGAIPGATP